MIDDIGSGALGPGRPPGVGDEPTAADGLAAGADLVLFSGDKLLGGPQCGIMVGTPRGDRPGRGRPADARPAARQDDAGRARGHACAGVRPRSSRRADPALVDDRHAAVELDGPRRDARGGLPRPSSGLNAAAVPAESYLGGGSAPSSRSRRRLSPSRRPFPIPVARIRKRPGPRPCGRVIRRSWPASRKGSSSSTCEPSPADHEPQFARRDPQSLS